MRKWTKQEVQREIAKILDGAYVGQDNDGQLVIYTGQLVIYTNLYPTTEDRAVFVHFDADLEGDGNE